MKTVSASVARQNLPELLGTVTHGGEQVVIERHGKPIAALVSLKKTADIVDTEGPEWDELAQVLPELNARLERMLAILKKLQRDNQTFRKEMDRLHAQRKQLVWRS
ncbi:MAG: type II toxin-antitoxin system Phd/YefM family antitoxin [Deltaproteobacteria bacterium]|nr:type II toxin-antitoxin system Phd/YefM family antitoxin [Deltaproteobacteria bacterium]